MRQKKIQLNVAYHMNNGITHQQNSIRLARLAPDEPDATSVPYYVWRHIDARDAIKFSQPTNRF